MLQKKSKNEFRGTVSLYKSARLIRDLIQYNCSIVIIIINDYIIFYRFRMATKYLWVVFSGVGVYHIENNFAVVHNNIGKTTKCRLIDDRNHNGNAQIDLHKRPVNNLQLLQYGWLLVASSGKNVFRIAAYTYLNHMLSMCLCLVKGINL